MRAIANILVGAAICVLAAAQARADPAVASVQQALKDQGFYYGEVTGAKDAETTAAIRRYQIRNGLQITGVLNAETQKSLGVKGAIVLPRSTPPSPVTPKLVPVPPERPDSSDLRDDAPLSEEQTHAGNSSQPAPESPRYAPDPRRLNLFDGTPFGSASLETQREVIIGAQSILARRGYYRVEIDGIFGPEMEFALRAYQARYEMNQTGRLDKETLGALGLLPGQQAPGVTAPRRRVYPPEPLLYAPNGERIYIPR